MHTFAKKPGARQPAAAASSTILGQTRIGQSHEVNAIHRAPRADAPQRQTEANTAASEAEATAPSLDWDFGRIPVHASAPARLQTKLQLGMPGDVHEQEADRVADQVMRMPEPAVQSKAVADISGHAMTPAARVQTKSTHAGDSGGVAAPPVVRDALRSPGQPLDAATRAFMEPRFGRDFGSVRVHTDAKAVESAAAIGARAYTYGRDIVFGADGSIAAGQGRALLAHELTHVVQQNGAGSTIRRQPEHKAGTDDPAKDADKTEDLPGEQAFHVLIDPLMKKTYKAGEKHGREAITDASVLTDKLTGNIRKYLRSPSGIALLQTFGDLPDGHALRLFAHDWQKAETRLDDTRVPGKAVHDLVAKLTSAKALGGYLGSAASSGAGHALEGSTLPKDHVEEVSDFAGDIAKDLAGKSPLLKRFASLMQNLNQPDVLMPASMISTAAALYGHKQVENLYNKIGTKKFGGSKQLGDVDFKFSAETGDTSYANLVSDPLSTIIKKVDFQADYKKATESFNAHVKYNEQAGTEFRLKGKSGQSGYNVGLDFLKGGETNTTFAINQDLTKPEKKYKIGAEAKVEFRNTDPSLELSSYASTPLGKKYKLFADLAVKLPNGPAAIDMRAGAVAKFKENSDYALVGQIEVTQANAARTAHFAGGLNFKDSAFLLGFSSDGKLEFKWYKTLMGR
jgi:hypothetical protein